jgi:hypothetical protein
MRNPTLIEILVRLHSAERENMTLMETIIEKETAHEVLEIETNRLASALSLATDLLERSTKMYEDLQASHK